MGESLAGSEKVKTSLPEANNEANNVLLNRAVAMGERGYMPYTGPVVAGFSPMQQAAHGNMNSMASAFGMGTMPQSGLFGDLSSIGIYDRALADLAARAPGQMDHYNSFFIDPQTGQPGSRTSPYEYIGDEPDRKGRRTAHPVYGPSSTYGAPQQPRENGFLSLLGMFGG